MASSQNNYHQQRQPTINKRRGGNNARSHYSERDHHEEDEVDDLAIAASYAMAVPTMAPPVRPDDDNEIDLMANENDNDDNREAGEGEEAIADESHGPVSNILSSAAMAYRMDPSLIDYDSDSSSSSSSSDDNDASQTNAADALTNMLAEDDEDDDDEPDTGPPKTKHEIINPVALMDQQLTLQEQDALGRLQLASQPSPQQQQQQHQPLQLAGTIQQFIVSDRMLVVQGSSSSNHQRAVLQPGTLLVLNMLAASTMNDNAMSATTTTTIVPCGKIVDVFGPVRQPLYSVYVGIPANNASESQTKKSRDNGGVAQEIKVITATAKTDVEADEAGTAEQVTRESSAEEIKNETNADTFATSSSTPSAEPKTVDPWSPHGMYTLQLLKSMQQQQAVSVYFIPDCTQVLDPSTLPRIRGCDASNAHDEEVTHPGEMDYSDDEQEQRAKKSNRRGGAMRSQQYGQGPLHGYGGQAPAIQGFHGYPAPAATGFLPHQKPQYPAGPAFASAQQQPPAAPVEQQPASDVVYYNF